MRKTGRATTPIGRSASAMRVPDAASAAPRPAPWRTSSTSERQNGRWSRDAVASATQKACTNRAIPETRTIEIAVTQRVEDHDSWSVSRGCPSHTTTWRNRMAATATDRKRAARSSARTGDRRRRAGTAPASMPTVVTATTTPAVNSTRWVSPTSQVIASA